MRHLIPALCLTVATGCMPGGPDLSTSMNIVDVHVEDRDGTRALFIDCIEGAREHLAIALPAGEDTELTDAIAAAWGRGVEVEVVTDFDQADDIGIANLMSLGIPVTLADDGIAYFDFNINRDVFWTSEQTIMSHAFVIADDYYATETGPAGSTRMVWATSVGTMAQGYRVVIEMRGEDIMEDLRIEHNQVFGGADAVATTAFDNLAKSIADWRWNYPTQKEWMLEMWFGPQERVVKRVIDSIYGARSTIWVLTDDTTNDGLLFAMQQKAEWGFDVKMVVGPRFRTTTEWQTDLAIERAPDVPIRQVLDVESVPTIVLIDYMPARDGQRHRAQAMMLNHDLYSTSRIGSRGENDSGREVINDQLIDGALFVLEEWDAPSDELLRVADVFAEHWQQGVEL